MKNKKEKSLAEFASIGKDNVRFICLKCGETEVIPKEVVDLLDGSDLEYDTNHLPQVTCKSCESERYPEYYRNAAGIEFQVHLSFIKSREYKEALGDFPRVFLC